MGGLFRALLFDSFAGKKERKERKKKKERKEGGREGGEKEKENRFWHLKQLVHV